MKEKIWLTAELRKVLVKKFSCTEQTVCKALNFKLQSKLGREIRCYSVNTLHGVHCYWD